MLGTIKGIRVYDDFAHHPTAIAATLEGLRAKVGSEQIIAVIEPRSNTMRMGVHQDALAAACATASQVLWYRSEHLSWDVDAVIALSAVQWMFVTQYRH